MDINNGGIVIIKGDNIESGGLKIVNNYQGNEPETPAKAQPLTREELQKKIDFVRPKIGNTNRLWFPVCRFMMWNMMVAEGDFEGAVNILQEMYPELKLDAKDLSSLNVLSFRKNLDQWTPDDAPVHGVTYNKYYAIAQIMESY